MILHSECTEYAKTAFIGDLAQCTVSFGKKCSKLTHHADKFLYLKQQHQGHAFDSQGMNELKKKKKV